MPNIPTAPVSLNDIHVAVGGTHETEVSLNDADVRAATNLTLNTTYSDLHGAGINTTNESTISIHEFRNAFYNTGSITYSLGFSIGDANLNETDDRSATLLFTVSNYGTAETYYWRIDNGSSDFTTSSGSITTTVGGGGSFTSADFNIQTDQDNLTEGTENFHIRVASDSGFTNILASATVSVDDTSLTPITYAGSFSVDSINENGTSTATFGIVTGGVADNTTVGYTISGVSVDDINLSSLTGTITIISNAGSLAITANEDLTTEGNETLTLTLDSTDSTNASVGSISDTVTINDTSTTPVVPTYAGSFDVDSIDENGTSAATFNVTTTNVANDTTVGYTISDVSVDDISLSSLTGTITINNNSGSVSFTANTDTTTEGNETLTLTLDSTDSNNDSVGAVSDTVIINDSSTTPAVPTYAIQGSDPLSINETSGSTTITVNTANVSNGTTLYWNITTNISGSSQASTDWVAYNSGGSGFTINNNTGSFTIDALADTATEGDETYYLHIRTGSDTGSSVDSIQLTVVDTSLSPSATSTMDVYPLYSTNPYTVSVSNLVITTSANTSTAVAEGYLLVEESGSDIIVYAAAGGAVLTGAGNSSTTSSLYKSENSTSTTVMTPIPETGTDYSNKEECFRISGLGGAGWSVSYGIDHQDAWATSPSGKVITWNPTTGHPTTIYNNYGDVTTSAQTITSGTNSRRALRFKLVALSGEGDGEINQQNDGSIRLTFSKSGQTDINVDTMWSLQCTARSNIGSGGGGFGGGGN